MFEQRVRMNPAGLSFNSRSSRDEASLCRNRPEGSKEVQEQLWLCPQSLVWLGLSLERHLHGKRSVLGTVTWTLGAELQPGAFLPVVHGP